MWTKRDGKSAPSVAWSEALRAADEFKVPVGTLLATCELESDFRLNLISGAGAVGPMQFRVKYAADYFRYAGFSFDLEGWEAIRGAAAIFRFYAAVAGKRGFEGEDIWRFAMVAHRWGQNSTQAENPRAQKRVLEAEELMRNNGLWYLAPAVDEEKAVSIAKGAADWARSMFGCEYSRAGRLREYMFDCSSLVARAFLAQGMELHCKGAPYPSSSNMVYDDQFALLWPDEYAAIGKSFGGQSALASFKQRGDLLFACSDMQTQRANRITHVAMLGDKGKIVHARGEKYGVCENDFGIYNGRICAILRYAPGGVLRKGMRGLRVLKLQRGLNAAGAGIEEDGIYGENTEKAAQNLGQQMDKKESGYFAMCTKEGALLREQPALDARVLGSVLSGSMLLCARGEGEFVPTAASVGGTIISGYMRGDDVMEVRGYGA